MPKVDLDLPDTSQSIRRPVVYSILNDIKEITQLPKDIQIYFPDDLNVMKTANNDLDSKDPKFASFATNDIMFVEIEEEYDKDSVGATAVNANEHLTVFNDDNLKVTLRPIYITSNMRINFRYRSKSKTDAFKWRDRIRVNVSKLMDIYLHDVTYHYQIPDACLIVLDEIYKTRESYLPYHESFEEYVTNHSSPRLTYVADLTNKSRSLAIAETQSMIQGMFDFDVLPDKPERDGEGGTWTVTFSYKFTYEKPIECYLNYPIIVHNQLLPANLIEFVNNAYNVDKKNLYASNSIDAFRRFQSTTILNQYMDSERYVKIPEYDDYTINNVVPGSGTCFMALSSIDPDDQVTLFNLKDLGDYIIADEIIEFMQNIEYRYMGNLYQSIFQLDLYINDKRCGPKNLIVDKDLNVKAAAKLDLRKQHRVRFALVTDLTRLNSDAIERLRGYPKALVTIIGSINEILRNHPDFTDLGNKSKVTALDFSPLYRILTGYDYSANNRSRNANYLPGRNVNDWKNKAPSFYKDNSYTKAKGLFGDLDPAIIENYRNNRQGTMTVMSTGTVLVRSEEYLRSQEEKLHLK